MEVLDAGAVHFGFRATRARPREVAVGRSFLDSENVGTKSSIAAMAGTSFKERLKEGA